MHKKMSFWEGEETKRFFQELSFYNALIEQPHTKHLRNIDLLHELPLYDKLSIVKISEALKIHARS